MKIKLQLLIKQETMNSHKTFDLFYIIALFCNSVTRKKRFTHGYLDKILQFI